MQQANKEQAAGSSTGRWIGLLAAALCCTGCAMADGATAEAGCDLSASAPAGLTEVRFVAPAACARESGDGSQEAPFAGLQAVQGLEAGVTLVLLPGTYESALTVQGGVDVVAAIPERTELRAGIRVEGAGSTALRGLRLRGTPQAGLVIAEATVELESSRIEGASGHGVEVRDGGSLALKKTAILSCSGVGVLAKGAGAISIVEPIFDVGPRVDADDDKPAGIVEPIFLPTTRIEGNGQGGIAIVEPIFVPTRAGEASLLLRGAMVRQNIGFGLALYGASAKVESSAIVETRVGTGGPWADGILIAPAGAGEALPALSVDGQSVLADNGRGGVVALAPSAITVGADISHNGYAGVWAAASGATLAVEAEARLSSNHLVGVGVSSGTRLTLEGATVDRTAGLSADADAIADGIGVFDGATAAIRDARLVENTRAAVLVHQAGTLADGSMDVTIDGTTFIGGKFAVVVNGAQAPNFSGKNSYESTDAQASGSGRSRGEPAPADRDEADFAVQTSYCTGASCLPGSPD